MLLFPAHPVQDQRPCQSSAIPEFECLVRDPHELHSHHTKQPVVNGEPLPYRNPYSIIVYIPAWMWISWSSRPGRPVTTPTCLGAPGNHSERPPFSSTYTVHYIYLSPTQHRYSYLLTARIFVKQPQRLCVVRKRMCVYFLISTYREWTTSTTTRHPPNTHCITQLKSVWERWWCFVLYIKSMIPLRWLCAWESLCLDCVYIHIFIVNRRAYSCRCRDFHPRYNPFTVRKRSA